MQIDQLIYETKLDMLKEQTPLMEADVARWHDFTVEEKGDHVMVRLEIRAPEGVVSTQTRRVDILNG